MTRMIARGLMGIIVIGLFCVVILNYYLRFSRNHNRLEKISEDYFQQVNNLIEKIKMNWKLPWKIFPRLACGGRKRFPM